MKNMGAAAERSHRKCSFLLGLAVFTCGLSLSAHGESDLNTCIGVDFDAKRPLIASGRPAENWKAAGEVTPLQNVPRQGTLGSYRSDCFERAADRSGCYASAYGIARLRRLPTGVPSGSAVPPNSPLLAKRGTKRCVCHSGKRFQPRAMDTLPRRVKPVRISI